MKPGHLMKGFVNQSLIDAMISDVVKSNILLREPQIFDQFFERVRFAFKIVGEIKDRDVIDVLPAPSLLLLRSEEHTSELQSLMRSSSAVFRLKKKNKSNHS